MPLVPLQFLFIQHSLFLHGLPDYAAAVCTSAPTGRARRQLVKSSKTVLACPADRAYAVVWEVVEGRPRRDSTVGVAFLRVVDPPTDAPVPANLTSFTCWRARAQCARRSGVPRPGSLPALTSRRFPDGPDAPGHDAPLFPSGSHSHPQSAAAATMMYCLSPVVKALCTMSYAQFCPLCLYVGQHAFRGLDRVLFNAQHPAGQAGAIFHEQLDESWRT